MVGNWKELKSDSLNDFACVIVQSPDAGGILHDFT